MTHRAAAESVGPDLTRLAGAAGSAFSRPLHHIIFTISHKQAVAGCSAGPGRLGSRGRFNLAGPLTFASVCVAFKSMQVTQSS